MNTIKTLKKTGIFLLYILFIISLISCSKDDPDPRDKFVGYFKIQETYTDSEGTGLFEYSIEIAKSGVSGAKILIANLEDLGMGLTIEAIVSGNSFTIPSQMIWDLEISGSGFISGNILTFTYSDSYGTGSCSGIRQ